MRRMMRRMMMATVLSGAVAARAGADRVEVRIAEELRAELGEEVSGRLLVFYKKREMMKRNQRGSPMDAPNFADPQPMAGVDIKGAEVGGVMVVDGASLAFPSSIDDLAGTVQVQGVLDMDENERSFEQGVGNLYSEVIKVDLQQDREEAYSLVLNKRIEAKKERTDSEQVKWVSVKSELLSAFYGEEVWMKAGVALPSGYAKGAAAGRRYGTVYVIPGFGAREEGVLRYARMLKQDDGKGAVPQAVYVVLDPECQLGHHGFANSANNGPRGDALVREFIPWMEEHFALAARTEGRILTGHSSGGWSSLWLQLNYPDTFGATWSSAPDPVDFRYFQMTDLYGDGSMFVSVSKSSTPSYRRTTHGGEPEILMTVQQETMMEEVLGPGGRSGQQWDSWEAMFSARDEASGLPRAMFDWRTGAIDKASVEHWKQYDIARKVSAEWEALGPVMLERVRLVVGSEDSFYLNRAVEQLKAVVEERSEQQANGEAGQGNGAVGGYIEVFEGEDHGSIIGATRDRWNNEMRAHLRRHGLENGEGNSREEH